MNTWDAITARRQLREFSPEAIPDVDMQRVLEAGSRAPSARNRERWGFVIVTNPAQLAELSGVWPGAAWIPAAPATIALVIPTAAEPTEREAIKFDLGQAAMLIMLAATDLGLASGQAGCSDQELARKVLGFPDDHECAMLIALGLPAGPAPKPIVKPDRRSVGDVAHFGRWTTR